MPVINEVFDELNIFLYDDFMNGTFYLNNLSDSTDKQKNIDRLEKEQLKIKNEILEKEKLVKEFDKKIKKIKYDFENYKDSYFDKFTENKYSFISKAKYFIINNYLQNKETELVLNNNDDFITMKYNFNEFNLDFITEKIGYNPNENLPFEINILENSLILDFIHFNSLIEKINNSNNRYFAIEMIMHTSLLKSSHSVLFIFDKELKISFVFDSSGDLNYFNDIGLTTSIQVNEHLKNALTQYCNLINFNFISLDDININISLNNKINSKKQSDFFKGYCRAWTYYIQELIINNKNNFSFDLFEKLKEINKQNLDDYMEILEIFQNKLYDDFVSSNPQIKIT